MSQPVKISLGRVALILPAVAALSCLPARAAKDWYFAGDAGLALQQTVDWKSYPTFFGEPIWTSSRAKFDPGYRLSLRAGRQFTNGFSVEFETGVIQNSLANSSDLFANRVNLDLYQIPILLNAKYKFGTWHGFSPYVGVGVGASISIVDGEAFAPPRPPEHSVRDDATLALQGTVGLNYQLGRHVNLEVLYKCLYAQQYDWVFPGGAEKMVNDSLNHEIGLGLRFDFDGSAHENGRTNISSHISDIATRCVVDRLYITGDAGVNFLDGKHWAVSKSLEFSTGYRADVALGYSVCSNWSVELELAIARNTASDPNQFFFDVISPHEVTLTQFPILINAVYRPTWNQKVKPFFGLGAGCVVGQLEVGLAQPGFFLDKDQSRWDTSAAAQATVGCEFPVTARLNVDLAYRALFTDGFHWGTFGSVFSEKTGLGINQSLTAGFRLRL
jgi:opacity protein-like surface antigen